MMKKIIIAILILSLVAIPGCEEITRLTEETVQTPSSGKIKILKAVELGSEWEMKQMRFEIAQLHKQYGITTIYVTHDQTEAMVISDRIAVLNEGRLMQLGTPSDIYAKPANKFVAGFMGTTNFIRGQVLGTAGDHTQVRTQDGLTLYGRGDGLSKGQPVHVAVRPENIEFVSVRQDTDHDVDRNMFDAKIARATYVGEMIDYQINLGDSLIRAKGNVRGKKTAGETVKIHLDPDQLVVLGDPPDTRQ